MAANGAAPHAIGHPMNNAVKAKRYHPCTVLIAAFLGVVALGLPVGAGPKCAEPRLFLLGDESKHAGEFNVPVSKSQILRLDVPFSDLLIGDSDIADVLALSDRSIYVLGKSLGATSLTIYDRGERLIAVVDVLVGPDIEGLKKRLFELMPDERVEIRSLNGAVVLSGSVSGAGRMSKILAVAERFAPGLVTNLLSVEGSQQVMLKVRFRRGLPFGPQETWG